MEWESVVTKYFCNFEKDVVDGIVEFSDNDCMWFGILSSWNEENEEKFKGSVFSSNADECKKLLEEKYLQIKNKDINDSSLA